MFNFNAIVQKAQTLIDPAAITAGGRYPSKATLFRDQFRLPDSENPLNEITAELTLPLPYKSDSSRPEKAAQHGNIYAGKLHISENYLCFSTQATSFQSGASTALSNGYTGQTHGAGPAGNGFTLPLCAVRKVERLHTQNALFALAITTWNGHVFSGKDGKGEAQRFTLQLAGSRQACDRFCDGLKKGLRSGIKQMDNMRAVTNTCYSEFNMVAEGEGKSKGQEEAGSTPMSREPPDAGLGMLFRYPGEPRKLRDRSKMRLWREYMLGMAQDSAHKFQLTQGREWPKHHTRQTAYLSQTH